MRIGQAIIDASLAFSESVRQKGGHLAALVGLLMPWNSAGRDEGNAASDETDRDFERWLHNDPMVTGNPASRYGDDSPGYLTSNGLGSMEIGAADD